MSLWKHLGVINKHKLHVTKLCFKAGLYKQGILHDLSKYSFVELKTGAKYFDGSRSPNGIERSIHGYSQAWLHHKGRNKHHWEYWVDFYDVGAKAPRIPNKYLVEMFCDRIAATIVYLGDNYQDMAPLEYYNRTQAYYIMEDESKRILEDMLEYLSNHGIDKSIKYAREKYLQKQKQS